MDLDTEALLETARHQGEQGPDVQIVGVEHAVPAMLTLLPMVEGERVPL